jgi:hypothetical protein
MKALPIPVGLFLFLPYFVVVTISFSKLQLGNARVAEAPASSDSEAGASQDLWVPKLELGNQIL